MIAELKNQWRALPESKRRLLAAGAAVTVLALLYTAAWRPLQKDLSRLRVDVPRQAEQLEWMRSQAPLAKAMRARAKSPSGPLLLAIEQSANTYGVRTYITKLDPEGSAGVRVTLGAAPFNVVMAWISELQAGQGLTLEEAAIDAHTTPGTVNAFLRLRAGGT